MRLREEHFGGRSNRTVTFIVTDSRRGCRWLHSRLSWQRGNSRLCDRFWCVGIVNNERRCIIRRLYAELRSGRARALWIGEDW